MDFQKGQNHFLLNLWPLFSPRPLQEDDVIYGWSLSSKSAISAFPWVSAITTTIMGMLANIHLFSNKLFGYLKKDFGLKIHILIQRVKLYENNDQQFIKKCQNLTFKVNFLCRKSFKSLWFFFHWRILF